MSYYSIEIFHDNVRKQCIVTTEKSLELSCNKIGIVSLRYVVRNVKKTNLFRNL